MVIHDRASPRSARVGPPATVMAFWSFGSEVPTGPLIERLSSGATASPFPGSSTANWRRGCIGPGIRSPRRCPVRGSPRAARRRPRGHRGRLTPGLAFDRRGYRVGYGKGYYDHFLAWTDPRDDAHGPVLCAVGRRGLPRGPADLPADVIVTEEERIESPELARLSGLGLSRVARLNLKRSVSHGENDPTSGRWARQAALDDAFEEESEGDIKSAFYDIQEKLGATFTPEGGWFWTESFGDLDAEYRAPREGVA